MYNGDSLHITLIETLCIVAIQSDNREEFPTIRDQGLEKVLSQSDQVDSSFVTRLPHCQTMVELMGAQVSKPLIATKVAFSPNKILRAYHVYR
ncbi:uncharacterized protein LOC110909752 [Helianthus annuus]|uniref:uncharacterized protein LOC110909752 n=1 Tax=Helianthus annuus TaxID=4232 RepID=UPI000B8FC7E4|nr:uncharacterized protein LOC110909752 [Helianthus annuus]XP_035840503.1 uncharacterized protein LOC110909752 [Helianthus annuus]